MVATAETDREIQFREWQKGHQAAVEGQTEDSCPWTSGLTRQWWLDGFNFRNYPVGMIQAQNL